MLLLSHKLMLLQVLSQVLSLLCLQLSIAVATATIVALSAVVIACGVAQAWTYCCIGKYTCVGGAAGAVTNCDCFVCSCLVILLHVLHKLFAFAADLTIMCKCHVQVVLH